MVAIIAGAGAFAAGAGTIVSLWMILSGWTLAVGGFSLDFYADRDLDTRGPRVKVRHNPLADDSLSPKTGLFFSISFITASFILTFLISPHALPFWAAILIVIVGLALHFFETPIARALTLGLLQALYLLMGAMAGHLSFGSAILAGMFFFAMFGGRGLTDIRDFPQDEATRVQTLPKRYGLKRTVHLITISLLIACTLSLAAYFSGEFSTIYLYLDLVFIGVSLTCTLIFARRPSPGLAYILTYVFMMGMGSVISMAIILGSL